MRAGEQQLLRTLRNCHAAIAAAYSASASQAPKESIGYLAVVYRQRARMDAAIAAFFDVLDVLDAGDRK